MLEREYQEGDEFYAKGKLRGIYTGKQDSQGRLILKDNIGEFPVGDERQYNVKLKKLENTRE